MRYALPGLLVLAACSGGGGGSSPSPPPPPPPAPTPTGLVSGASPFSPSCGLGSGTLYVNAEVEPSLAVNPLDPNHLVAAWQQDRWSNGSARGIVSAASLDGGATWTYTQPPFSRCAGGPWDRATDPWLSFGPAGTVFQAVLVTSGGSLTPGSANAVLVARSGDGGRTWDAPVAVITDGGDFFNDKEAVTADPRDARFAYASWDRLSVDSRGPAYFARTTDGGATWEAARAIFDPGAGRQTIGNLVRVLADGTLVNVFMELEGDEDAVTSARVRLVRSTDRGATWSGAITISDARPLGARDPTTGQGIRDGSIVPQAAAGPDGSLHVVWQDGRFTGVRDGVAYARSTDGGLTWSAPVRVNGNPGATAFTPNVHVRADGVVGVTWYDLRADTADPATLPTEQWIARSTDGVAWSESRVAGPFDLATAPQSGGAYFLGDYMGLASAGTAFLSLHVRTNADAGNRTDVYLTRVAAPTSAKQLAADDPARRLVERDSGFGRRVAANLTASACRRLDAIMPRWTTKQTSSRSGACASPTAGGPS